MSKIISVKEAVDMVKDGMTLGIGGFVTFGLPEDLLIGLQNKYRETKTPKNLFAFHCAGIGDGGERGGNRIAEDGLVKKLVCAHLGLEPRLSKLIVEDKLAAYTIPQGVTSQLLRAIAGGKPGVLSHVGLRTFVDPRLEGGKANKAAVDSGEDVVSVVSLENKEYLFYKSFPIDICFIKGTYADEYGNISLEREAVFSDQLEMAAATHNSGGIVIAQVDQIVKKGNLKAHNVKVHGFMVDYIVEGTKENSVQTFLSKYYRPEMSGETTVTLGAIEPMKLDQRKICGRRGAFELKAYGLINLGIGVPEAVASVAGEEGFSDKITLSIESGVLGGVPTGGIGIGGTVNPESIYKQPDIFDIYDGGGIDVTFLGAAEIDAKGNVNVSKFANRVVGPGGFINISQNAKKVCFTGTFKAGKMDLEIKDGKLNIINDGKNVKFKNKIEQITFSGEYASETGQEVYYITERAVFKLIKKGIMLIEIAPGVDLQKDILANMEFKPIIAEDLKLMDERIFKDEKMGISI